MPETDQRRKVLHFTVSAGGIKRHILELAEGTDRARTRLIGVFPDEATDAVLFQNKDSRYRAAFDRLGLEYHILEVPRGHSFLQDIKSIFTLAGILRREKPDILHLHSSKAGFIGRLAALIGRPRAVCYTPQVMFYTLNTGLKRFIYFWVEKFLAPLTSAIIAVSASEYEELQKDLKLGRRLTLINNGVKPFTGRYDAAEIRRAHNLAPDDLVILSPTRLEPQKDVRTLILAMEKVRRQVPQAVLLVAGEGAQRTELEVLIETLGLRRHIRLLGWVDGLEPLMYASDIVALSSVREGMPFAVLEASAMGKPTVGSDVVGTRDCIREGVSGFLLPAGDSAGFADRVIRLGLDSELRQAMGRDGRRMIETEFTCQRTVDKLEDLYARLAP